LNIFETKASFIDKIVFDAIIPEIYPGSQMKGNGIKNKVLRFLGIVYITESSISTTRANYRQNMRTSKTLHSSTVNLEVVQCLLPHPLFDASFTSSEIPEKFIVT